MRLRKKPWIAEALASYTDIVVQGCCQEQQGRWSALFGNDLPLHVEIGTGRGRFITGMAEQLQGKFNFIGIESQRDVLYDAALKARELAINNIRLLLFDANNLLDAFAAGEIERMYINFCDPWPKNRHAKRRLTHCRFLEKYRIVLKPGGQLWFKTDNQVLFEFSLEQFQNFGVAVDNISYDLHASGFGGNVMTEYESRFSRLGQPIYRCEVHF